MLVDALIMAGTFPRLQKHIHRNIGKDYRDGVLDEWG